MSVVSPPSRIVESGSGYAARWQQHNSERQLRILRAAVELLEAEPAGADIPVRRIAQCAGVAKSVVYRQFAGREDLDRRIRSYIIEDLGAILTARLDTRSGSVREIITRTVRAAAEWMVAHPNLIAFARGGPPAGAPETIDAVSSLKTAITQRSRAEIVTIAGVLDRDAAAVEQVPFAVVTMVEGVLAAWTADPDPDRTLDEVVENLSDYAWYVLDGAARSYGVVVDPDRELTVVIAELARADGADGPAARG